MGPTPSTVLLPSHSLRDDTAANAEAFVSVWTKTPPVFGVMSRAQTPTLSPHLVNSECNVSRVLGACSGFISCLVGDVLLLTVCACGSR